MVQNLSLKESVHLWGIDREGPYCSMLLDFIERRAKSLAANLVKPKTEEAWLHQAPALRARLLHSLGLSRLPDRCPPPGLLVGEAQVHIADRRFDLRRADTQAVDL